MNLLAIETSASYASVALLQNDKVQGLHRHAPMQQTEIILSMIKELIAKCCISLHDLDAIAFGCGPGSFTGVRIAASTTQGLAFALQIPVISVSSLAALAQTAHQQHGCDKVVTLVDARMQEVYWARFHLNKQNLMELQGEEKVSSPKDVALENMADYYGVGNGWQAYDQHLPKKTKAQDLELVADAVSVARLAKDKYEKKQLLKPEEAVPNYVRHHVAKKMSDQ